MPSLSISSSMSTGFLVPARRSPWTICPGSAPMYVRRWPRISASSRMPPSEMRWNFRPSARAIDRPSDVLPTPGGPTKQRIGSLPLRPDLLHRQVLEDPVLDLLQPLVILVQDPARRDRDRRRRWSPASTASPPASRCRCGPPCTPRRPAASWLSRSSSRSASRLSLLGHPGRLDLLPEGVDLLRCARRSRPAPSGSPSAARAGSTRAGSSTPPTAPRTGSSSPARGPRPPWPSAPASFCSRSLDVERLQQLLLELVAERGQRRRDEVGERARARRRCPRR